MKVTKSTAEVYLIEGLPHHGWAKFTVESLGEKGRLSVASDYGDWQHGWGFCGRPFKEFLAGLDMSYVARKFGADEEFDVDRTLTNMKRDLLTARRQDDVGREQAKAIWQEIDGLDFVTVKNEFCVELERSCPNLLARYDWMPPLYDRIHPLFVRFWDEAWSLFVVELKRETVIHPV